MCTFYKVIEQKLKKSFTPIVLSIVDESHLHAGHQSFADSEPNETHFKVLIVSDFFKNKSRVERQRIIYDLLKKELKQHIHALSLTVLTNEEFEVRKSTLV